MYVANADVLGRDMIAEPPGRRGMKPASTDMGNVSQVVPAIHPYMGIGSLPYRITSRSSPTPRRPGR